MHALIGRALGIVALSAAAGLAQAPAPLRALAVPLITHDPYFSIWSMADRLTDEPAKHWTGAEQPITGIAQVEGRALRFMGGAAGAFAGVRAVSTPPRP